jgi:DNA anti-recombination protein RmuC
MIVNNILLIRRINELLRQRQELLERQEQLRTMLPDWTLEPLRLAGISAREIESMICQMSMAEQQLGVAELDRELEQLDRQIEEAENQLISSRGKSLDSIGTILQLAIGRMRRQKAGGNAETLFDYGEARVMFMLENVADDLLSLTEPEMRAVG